jgi:hypothetical protein
MYIITLLLKTFPFRKFEDELAISQFRDKRTIPRWIVWQFIVPINSQSCRYGLLHDDMILNLLDRQTSKRLCTYCWNIGLLYPNCKIKAICKLSINGSTIKHLNQALDGNDIVFSYEEIVPVTHWIKELHVFHFKDVRDSDHVIVADWL